MTVASVESIKPTVVIFRNELLPASETFIEAQARALVGFEPIFAGVHGARNSLRLPTVPVLIDAASDLGGKLRRLLYWRGSIAPGFCSKLRKLEPSLVHAHFALDGAAALPIATSLRIPLVVTLHGYDVTSDDSSFQKSEQGRLYLRRRRSLWEQTSVFVCISEFIRERAIQKGFPRSKLRTHYTGVDLSSFSAKDAARDRNCIVFVGRLVEKKGCERLLDALVLVRSEHPAVRLVVIGTGPLESKLRSRVSTEQLPCTFLGAQPPQVVREHLAGARLLCVPSMTASNGDSEGLGMVFAEAQAMGTPVVSFLHGGIGEVVLQGETGLLVTEGDSHALAKSLLLLLQEDDRWYRYSEQGKKWIREAFDLRTQTALLEDIYRSTLNIKVGAGGVLSEQMASRH
jgi:colanic acid/amylovoran biosynthesis glycosyltransferase